MTDIATRQVQRIRAILAEDSEGNLVQAAKRVVWARYVRADDGWEQLKEAIGQLEQIVGRPEKEP